MPREGRHFTNRPSELRGYARIPEVPLRLPQNTKPEEKYPEHQKLQAVHDKSQEMGSFIEWLRNTKKFVFAQWLDVEYEDEDPFTGKKSKHTNNELVPQALHIEETLAEYFGIDLKKLEQEKQTMLEEMRQINKETQTQS